MRIISPGWWSRPARSEFPKSPVIVCCGVSRNKMVTFDTRQRISRVFPIRFPRLSRKAANVIEFSLRDSFLSFLVFSEYLGRFGSETKIVWVARICQNMSHFPLCGAIFRRRSAGWKRSWSDTFSVFLAIKDPVLSLIDTPSDQHLSVAATAWSQVINCSPTDRGKRLFRQYAANRQQQHRLVTLIYACYG